MESTRAPIATMEQLKRVSLRTHMISGSGRNQQRLRCCVVRRCVKTREHRPTPYRDLHNLHDHHKRNVLDTRDAIGSSLAPTHETYLLALTLRRTPVPPPLRPVTPAPRVAEPFLSGGEGGRDWGRAESGLTQGIVQ